MSAFSLVLQYGLAIIGIIRSALGDATISTPHFYETILSPFPLALNVPLSVIVGFILNAGKRSLQTECCIHCFECFDNILALAFGSVEIWKRVTA